MDRQSRLPNQHATFISSHEACELLNVKPATLYTYVSRGLIYRIPTGRKRQSRYSLVDVLNLKSRADARSGHGPVAADALDWGQPVIKTSICTVGEKAGITYRGHAVLELCRRKTRFEAVAELLWTSELVNNCNWPNPQTTLPSALESLPADANPHVIAAAMLPLLAAADSTRYAATQANELRRAREIIRLVAASVAHPDWQRAQRALRKRRLSQVIATALALPDKKAPHLDKILVLCAEHELNASTFAARIAASTRADLYACLAAAIGTHSGPRQGQAVDRVLAILNEIRGTGDAAAVMQARLKRGESISGFGHKLYPHGDPRAEPLMKTAQRIAPQNRDVRLLWKLVGAAKYAQYHPPNLDIGIAMMTTALGIADAKASCLFMIGRFAGWIAHILEQRKQPLLLRPRAETV